MKLQKKIKSKKKKRNYEPEHSWTYKSRTQGWGQGLRAEDTNLRTVSTKMTLWALRPDFTLGETIKGEMAKHQPWDVPPFKGYADKADF